MSINNELRFSWIDYCKGLAIILVVFGHVNRGLNSANFVTNQSFFKLIDSIIYSFHMPLFFFLSGILFFNTKKNSKGIITSKIDTIVYPFILWSLLQGFVEVIFTSYTNKHQTFNHLIYDLFVVPKSQFWFLYALFFCFLLAIIIFRYIPQRHTFLVLIISSLLYLSINSVPDFFLLKILSRYFVFFILGTFFYSYVIQSRVFNLLISNKYTLYFLLFMTVSAQYVYHKILGLSYLDVNILSLGLSILTIFLAIAICFFLDQKQYLKWLLTLGYSSMVIYVMHVFITSGFRIFLSKLLNVMSYPLHLIAGTILGVVIPVLIMKFLKRMNAKYYIQAPLSKWLNISSDSRYTKY